MTKEEIAISELHRVLTPLTTEQICNVTISALTARIALKALERKEEQTRPLNNTSNY
jgi:hypothetical protein